MRIPYAFLLLPVVMWAGVSRAQTHNQTTAQPSSGCAHIPEAPDASTNTDEYNAGYHNGYLEACKAMSAPRAKAPSVQADSAINTDILVPPDQAGISLQQLDIYNGKLLAILQHVCPKHYRELSDEATQNGVWENFKWRMNVLQDDIAKPKSPEKCK